MVAVFDQHLGSAQSKTAGTSLVIDTGTATVTEGKTIFVGFASDDAGSSYSVTDGLGNSYSLVGEQVNTGNVKVQLWRADVTSAGTQTLTSITISWTTNVTAKAAVAGEFSNFDTFRTSEGANTATGDAAFIASGATYADGELWVGVGGCERGDNLFTVLGGPPNTGTVNDIGTSGGGAASNITATLCYAAPASGGTTSNNFGARHFDFAGDTAGFGVIYNGVVLAAKPRPPYVVSQAVNRAATI